jgi:hypothetical protein
MEKKIFRHSMMYTSHAVQRTPTTFRAKHNGNEANYKASVKSLFSLAILDEIEESIVRSPISTTRPPRIVGSTCAEISVETCVTSVDTDLVGDLQLLALANVLGFSNGGL